MVGHIDTAVTASRCAAGDGGHIAPLQAERTYAVGILAHVFVHTHTIFHFLARVLFAVIAHEHLLRSGVGHYEGTVEVDGHAAVGAVAGGASVDLYLRQVFADDVGRQSIVEDEPRLVARQVDVALGEGSRLGDDVEVDLSLQLQGGVTERYHRASVVAVLVDGDLPACGYGFRLTQQLGQTASHATLANDGPFGFCALCRQLGHEVGG